MPFIGNKPSAVPLTSADIADSIITSAKITDATIVNGDIANSTIALAKLSATGTPSAATFLRGDNSWGSAGAAAGQVIQVVSTTKSDYFTASATTTFTDITGLSVSITPSSSSNKILIMCDLAGGGNDCRFAFRLVRDSTAISVGNADGSRQQATVGMCNGLSGNDQINASFNFLDSPSATSSTTYKVQFIAESNLAINGSYGNFNGNSAESSRTTSTITVMEIKG
jgi:hypothetical protein